MEIEIIAHRGLWKVSSERNTLDALTQALEAGYGIETDIRDCNKSLVISHDMPDDKALGFEALNKLMTKYPDRTYALNIKSDGLQAQLSEVKELGCRYFFFDMSVPDTLGYISKKLNVYSRYSEIEPTPALYDKVQGVWLDNFIDSKLNVLALEKFLSDGLPVALVSPELHGREHLDYWNTLREFLLNNPELEQKIALCTDFPEDAESYFS